MENFTPITTQEEFNAAVGKIRDEARERAEKKFEGYVSPDEYAKATAETQKQIDELTKTIEDSAKKYASYDEELADRDARIKSYETASVKSRIAHELGLPYGAADRLRGDTEEEIRKDAESCKALFKTPGAAPLKPTEQGQPDAKTAGLKNMLNAIPTF